MATPDARRAEPVETEASLRADLAGQIAGAQAQLETNIEELRRAALAGGDSAALSQAEGQLQRLGGLQRRLEHAGPGALAAIRAEVVASVAASQATAQLVRSSTSAAQAAEMALHAASAAAHRTVSSLAHAMFEEKKYDALLQFDTDAEKDAYAKRAAERQRYIEEQLALGTPQGNLNAARVMSDQLKDAGAHGASEHPDYANDVDKLARARADLEHAMQTSTRQQAANDQRAIEAAETIAPAKSPELDAITAQLRAAGIVSTPPATEGHGVTVQVAANGAPQRG